MHKQFAVHRICVQFYREPLSCQWNVGFIKDSERERTGSLVSFSGFPGMDSLVQLLTSNLSWSKVGQESPSLKILKMKTVRDFRFELSRFELRAPRPRNENCQGAHLLRLHSVSPVDTTQLLFAIQGFYMHELKSNWPFCAPDLEFFAEQIMFISTRATLCRLWKQQQITIIISPSLNFRSVPSGKQELVSQEEGRLQGMDSFVCCGIECFLTSF